MNPTSPRTPTEELRELHEQTSFGKTGWTAEFYDDETQWVVRRHDRVIVAEQCSEETARFIAAVRDAVPSLLTELEASALEASKVEAELVIKQNALDELAASEKRNITLREAAEAELEEAQAQRDRLLRPLEVQTRHKDNYRERLEAAEAESKALREKLELSENALGFVVEKYAPGFKRLFTETDWSDERIAGTYLIPPGMVGTLRAIFDEGTDTPNGGDK